jgi:hypothetical protein
VPLAPAATYSLIRWTNRLAITAVIAGAISLPLIIKFIPSQPGKAIFYPSIPLALMLAQWLLRKRLYHTFKRYRQAGFLFCIPCGYPLSSADARCTECGDTTPLPKRQAWWHQCAHQFPHQPPTAPPSAPTAPT